MNNYIDKKINIKELNQEELLYDLILLENNERQINQICEFLNSQDKILAVTGFSGTGKSSVVNFVVSNVNENIIKLNYNCFETTTLDDMFLSFFETFRNYTVQGKIPPLKTKTENFSQKINSYFNNIDNKILLVINSFEAILKNNKELILDFIKQIHELDNIKIIIISRTMMTKDLQELKFINVPILAMQQSLFEKHLRYNGIKHIGVLSNELYKQTKGYYNNLRISEHLINLKNINLGNFLENYSKSLTPFIEYLHREILAYVDPTSSHLFRLLAIMRIPLHINLIKSLHLYDEERIDFFFKHCLLDKDGECVYIKDYYRSIIENQIPENTIIKLHKSCIDLYNTQLPLKPLERDLRLSRQTMRNEIEFHEMFLPKRPILQNKNTIKPINTQILLEPSPVLETNQTPHDIIEETKEEKINKITFIFEDEDVLDDIAQSIQGFVTESDQKNKIINEYSQYSLMKIMNMAKDAELERKYEEAILLYQNALTKKDDDNFYTFLPTIYLNLAKTYKRISQWYEALENYTQAQDFYYNIENYEKISDIKYEMAEIYYTIYKHDNARYLLNELENNKNLSNNLQIKINLLQVKLCNNINKEYSYYKKSLELISSTTDKSIITELYYKFAGINDERNETKLAVQYYKRCIYADSNPHTNRFLAGAYANLAEIYYESGYIDYAINYYIDSIKYDQSIMGGYDSSSRLAELYDENKDYKEELVYLEKALTLAKELKDNIYITEATISISDYYIKRKLYDKAFKYCNQALTTAKTKEKIDIINKKLEMISSKISGG